MTLATLWSVIAFAFGMSATPGPNNVMLTASGAIFGLRATWPHIFGIVLGFPIMLVCLGAGLTPVFTWLPHLHLVLKAISIVYLCWLASRIASARPVGAAAASARPFTFVQAAAFQWVNPKGWIIAIGAVAFFTSGSGPGFLAEVATVAVINAIVALLTSIAWTTLGVRMGRHLTSPRAQIVFNRSMAALLLASLLPTAYELVSALA